MNIDNKFILSVYFDCLRMFWACGGGCRHEGRFFSFVGSTFALEIISFVAMAACFQRKFGCIDVTILA